MSNDLLPTESEIRTIEVLAKYASQSKFFEKLGGVGGIMSIMMYAKELGISPLQAVFGGMNNVLGKIEISHVMLNSLIRRKGHKINVIEHTDKVCELEGVRADNGQTMRVSYSIEDAKRAGIYKEGSGWTKYPKDMVWARSISRIGRRLFPDAIGPMYVIGEASEAALEDEAIDAKVETIGEQPKEQIEDITVEQSCEMLSQGAGIPNDSTLKGWVEFCRSNTKNSLRVMTDNCLKNKESFVTYVEKFRAKTAV